MSIHSKHLNVRPVGAFSDNYIWLIDSPRAPGRIVAVDPLTFKRQTALALGATDAVDPADGAVPDQIAALTEVDDTVREEILEGIHRVVTQLERAV